MAKLTFGKLLAFYLLAVVGLILASPWFFGAIYHYTEWVRHIMMGLR